MPLYVFDSSIWIDAWRRYPPDIFVSLWNSLDSLIDGESLKSPEEVCYEIERGQDGLATFLKARKELFHPLDGALQEALKEVVARYALADPESDRSRADPFVVALGKLLNGVVVTAESPSRGRGGRPKIPDACAGLDLRCIKWLEFLREQRWSL